MLSPKFVILAAAVDLSGSSSYAWDTFKGTTRPNRVSWTLWALAPLIAFAAQIGKGVGWQSLLTFVVGFGPCIVLLASFANRRAVWKLSVFDYICGGLSLAGIGLWVITREGNFAIATSIAADFLAALPTLVKSFNDPASESGYVFLLGAIAAGITLLTVEAWTFEVYAFPFYILLICLVIFLTIHFKLGKRLNKKAL